MERFCYTSHFRFVSGHEKHIARIAVLSDKMASKVLPEIAKHFVHPVLKHFPQDQNEEALRWLAHALPDQIVPEIIS